MPTFWLVFVNYARFSEKWRNYGSMFVIHCPTFIKTQTTNNQHLDAILGNYCNYAPTKLEFWVTSGGSRGGDQPPYFSTKMRHERPKKNFGEISPTPLSPGLDDQPNPPPPPLPPYLKVWIRHWSLPVVDQTPLHE